MPDLNLEIDGKAVQVPSGSTVMDAANKLGTYVPHFCYHKKLSIAANCRMCLVQVEKAPKPMPACATPVMEGMKVYTQSEQAKKAQAGVMEFLLINHPLDCPICDQGGECQLQDLAVGYGGSGSRYDEPKRIVFHKNVGPLVSMEEMSRCIHCTRCVRFGQEVAGVMELGMGGRGEHSEIQSFVGKTVDSELSGNMIDVCPVGALTSKPFRYAARTWELQRKKSVSPHDGLGSNIVVQAKGQQVLRVLAGENEDINECWISDRDRFSYEALNSENRLTKPEIKQNGVWQQVDWSTALEYVRHGFTHLKEANGGKTFGILASPNSTLEELALLNKLAANLGTTSIDSRLKAVATTHSVTLGMPIKEVSTLDRVLVIGSSLRNEQPLLTARIRQAVKKGAELSVINTVDEDLAMPVKAKSLTAQLALGAQQVAVALAKRLGKTSLYTCASTASAEEIAASLATAKSEGKLSAVFLGELALNDAQATQVEAAAAEIAGLLGARWGRFAAGGNTVGAMLAGVNQESTGAILTSKKKAFMIWNNEPELDSAFGHEATLAMQAAETVVYANAFDSATARTYADVLLPISPFTETAGTYVNMAGTAQTVQAVVRPLGESRPGWKVLRVLGELLGAKDVAFDTAEAVRDSVNLSIKTNVCAKADNVAKSTGLTRIAHTPIYFADSLCRNAFSLQKTVQAKAPQAMVNATTAKAHGLSAGDQVEVTQGQGKAILTVQVSESIADQAVQIAQGHASTATLGQGSLSLKKVSA